MHSEYALRKRTGPAEAPTGGAMNRCPYPGAGPIAPEHPGGDVSHEACLLVHKREKESTASGPTRLVRHDETGVEAPTSVVRSMLRWCVASGVTPERRLRGSCETLGRRARPARGVWEMVG
jgi:hypothetical protein